MKAIMLMFDSLNRHMLPPYGCDWIQAPNFQRLAERSLTFDACYAGSLPCMPARREMHTGRYNFLHRSWGPLEPFDDSMPQILREHGVYTHLVSDHYHYWEDGGATYHNRYSSWEFFRGQEGDPWQGEVKDPGVVDEVAGRTGFDAWRRDWVNRKHMQREEDLPQYRTIDAGMRFMRTNRDEDNWFLQLETFDPHEPFYTTQKYKDLYPHDYDGPHFDWPSYRPVQEPPEQVEHCRYEYAALVSMCDAHLGKVLDLMDELAMWDDTLLIVNTDHGFSLGEHGWWAKCRQPFYEELAHTPLFIWDPRAGVRDRRCPHVVQTIDLAPTLLEYFGVDRPPDMQGVPLRDAIAAAEPARAAGLFGLHGAHVNVTDGRYVYMRAPVDAASQELYDYTLLPTHMTGFFSAADMAATTMVPPFGFTKGYPLMRCGPRGRQDQPLETLLFDLAADPGQENPIADADVEARMIEHMVRLMDEHEAPPEQYRRLGLAAPEAR